MILKSNGKSIATDIEFACSIFKQAQGLMFRKSIPDDYAMIFVLKKKSKVSLHMLFVNFPIDVIFLDEKKNVVKTSVLRPWIGTCSSDSKVKYIIETNPGTVKKRGIKNGDSISFENKC
ncbi:DUF192 domain-containing protein [Methanolobus sp. ZRKC3]|uniref:DUF192 domain-containing protein n=1 Tax=Methanolobus sp. ZRKC3 TaxID=3125786 RepID=UPI00324D538A